MKTKRPATFVLRPSFMILLFFALLAPALRAPAQVDWGNAISFNGTSNYVSVPSATWFSGDLTVEAWVYVRSYGNWGRVIDFGNGTTNNILLAYSEATTGKPIFQIYAGGSSSSVESPTPLPTNQWVHLAATLQNTTGTLYVNGAAMAVNAAMVRPSALIRTNNYIGRSNWGVDDCANAVFDDVRIWNVARSEGDLAAHMSYPLTGSETNLLAYWRFNEGSGTTAFDATTNGYHATLVNGPQWTLSTIPPWGNALALNGVNQYVSLPTNTWFSGDCTIETWFCARVNYYYEQRVFDFGNGTNDSVVLCYFSGNNFMPYFRVYTNTAYTTLWITNGAVSPNQWVHLAATISGNTGTVFMNGQPVASGPMKPPRSVNRTNNFIGRSNRTGDPYANAIVEEFRIWNVARSGAQIRETMDHPLTGTETNLVAYYRFDELSGNTAHDATPNHRAGTLFNSPTRADFAAPFINVNPPLPVLDWSSVGWGDYDSDSRLDLLLTGGPTQIWRNNGNSTFSNINVALPQLWAGSVAWGDGNNDGLLDIVMVGPTNGYNNWAGYLGQVWQNNGNNTFSNLNVGLPRLQDSCLTWGDYNNDGRVDILLGGREQSGYSTTQLWRNDGNGQFTHVNTPFPYCTSGSIAWGDYDNDGRLDLLLTGLNNAQVWHNNGDGTFSNINVGLPYVSLSSAAWGDYDNDGRLDILLAGRDNYSSRIVSQVWRNCGNGTFTNINAGLTGICKGTAAWGDYDNDGLLDILLMGASTITPNGGNGIPITQVWRNCGNGTFANINAGMPGFWYGSAAWGDYDGDGRLDLLLTGWDTDQYPKTQLWRNMGARTNTPPTAPTTVGATVVGRQVELSWTATTDAETPGNGLSYNVRLGTSPGAIDIVAPQANADGFRQLPARGNVQPGAHALVTNLALGEYYWSVQAVDTAFAGSPFSEEGHFVIYPPDVGTGGGTAVSSTVATFDGTGCPMQHDTAAWFEYGLTMAYGNMTGTTNLGDGADYQDFQLPAANLLPWMTYHYRAVASNCVGVVFGGDATVTMPGPSLVTPLVTGLTDLTLPQGGSTSVWFTVSPPGLAVRVRSSNPVLLPASGLVLGGSGSSRSLGLVPAANQSGTARVTVTATDGSRPANQTFNVTVTPSAGSSSSLLHLADARVVSTQAWRFRLVDAGTGSTNYTVEYRSSLAPTNVWAPATNFIVTPLGSGVCEVAIGPPPQGQGFYRAMGFRLLTAGFNSAGVTVEEGAASAGPVLVFNGIYVGVVTCIWTDPQGTSWTNQVAVNGTTAVIPVPAAYLTDNAAIGQLRSLTLQLQGGAGFALANTAQTAVTLEENDAEWQGVLQTSAGNLDFSLTLLQTNGGFEGSLQSETFGFFPTNTLAQLNFTEDTFTAVATNIPLAILADSPAWQFTTYLDLRLEAVNSPGQTNVSPTRIQGVALLINKVPDHSHLDIAPYGTFTLLRPPTAPATNDVPLFPAP
jgi:hypothetical protein